MDTKQSYFPWEIVTDKPLATKPWAVKIKNRNNAVVVRCEFASTCYTDSDLARINMQQARLIVEAPNLLSLLKSAKEYVVEASSCDEDAKLLDEIDAAISAVEGRTATD